MQPRQMPLGIPITGSLSAMDSALVKARIPGELRDLQLREGDRVTRGQVIARVDATETEARFRQAKLQADAAQAQVTIAQRQYDNNRALVAKGFISDTALTASLSNLQAAQANHAAARAAQDAARKNLDDTVLRSPIDGQIASRMAQNGERVNVEAPIVEVVNLSALELEAQIPANDSAQVQIGRRQACSCVPATVSCLRACRPRWCASTPAPPAATVRYLSICRYCPLKASPCDPACM